MTQVLSEHIVSTPGTCGGKPRIAKHRITVANVAVWHEKMRLTADEIADQYDLTLAEIYAALAYYHDHRKEIDASLEAERRLVAQFRKNHPSLLRQKLRERARGRTA
jgi:uncharacterized protein (DUF433 family)